MVIPIRLGLVNVFFLRGERGAVLVDTGNPGGGPRLADRLKEQGVEQGEVRLILLTHGHQDHYGGAAELAAITGAPVAVHAGDAGAVRRGVNDPATLQPTGWLMKVVRRVIGDLSTPLPGFEPDLVFEEGFRLDGYGIAGRVIPTPGHTPGSVSVLLDSGEAIVGDAVMGKGMGLLRQPGWPIVAWDLERDRESMRQLLALSPSLIYTGHGGPFSPQAVARLVSSTVYPGPA